MKKIHITNQNIDNRYIDLFGFLYKEEKNIDYFMSDIKISVDYSVSVKHISTVALLDNEVLLGHCSIITSKEYINETAYFGFFESPENEEDLRFFWENILVEAKKRNIKKLIGPVNGSIWFPYRFINNSNNSPLFKGELPTKFFYYDFFSNLGNGKITTYSSGARKSFDLIIEATRKSHELLNNSGLKIEVLSEVSREILMEIHILAEEIFSQQSIAYEAFPVDYFLQLYSNNRMKDLFKTYIVRNNGKLIAFCNIFYENEKVLILKTLAVHPLFQKHGIGGAIVHLAHCDAKEKGIEQIIYALVRDDNNIKFFPKDDVSEIRTYSLFEFNI
ncbi:MAG: GNAT family N-acetyltransferase [Candidatus Pacebacteria bacterium]|nr:GNAT family N-acetyltransferase [Candidatus Paceibacterota bacterium]MCF7863104.1 GNAT family N-acetyltransferase [Candidatus Paceibacterota bacterium]